MIELAGVPLVLAVKTTEPLAQTGRGVDVLIVIEGLDADSGSTLQPTETELRFITSRPAAMSFGRRFFFATPLVTVAAITSVGELYSVWVI